MSDLADIFAPKDGEKEFPEADSDTHGIDEQGNPLQSLPEPPTVSTVSTVSTVIQSQSNPKTDSTSESSLSEQMEEEDPPPPKRKIIPRSEHTLIRQTLYSYKWDYDPSDPDQHYVEPMWGLACQLSKYPSLQGEYADDVADEVESLISWRELPGIDDDEIGRDKFIECWQKIQPGKLGKEAYMIALDNMKKFELIPVKRPSGRVTNRFTQAVNIAYRLQEVEGDAPMALSCRTFGDMLGVHFTDADIYLRRMVHEGFLKIEEPARKKMQRAARYRFIGKVSDDAIEPEVTV